MSTLPRAARATLAAIEAQRDRERATFDALLAALPDSQLVAELRHHWRIETQLDALARDLRRDDGEAA